MPYILSLILMQTFLFKEKENFSFVITYTFDLLSIFFKKYKFIRKYWEDRKYFCPQPYTS